MERHPLYSPRPTAGGLWRGCILATVAEALYSARTGYGGPGGWYRWWEDGHYRLDNGGGDLGTITFADGRVVGVFFAHESERSPWNPDRPPYDLDWYFRGMPADLRALAEQDAVPYMTDPSAPGGLLRITAAVWSEGGLLEAAEPWPNLFWHGLVIIETELRSPERALSRLQSDYNLTALQMHLLQTLYARKVAKPTEAFTLTSEERTLLVIERPSKMPAWKRQRLTGDENDEGIALCRELLAPIGIIVP